MIQGTFTTPEGIMGPPSRIQRLVHELARPMNAVLAISWIVFVFIWIGGWNDAVLFNAGWWFDTAGHAIFGFFGALMFYYLFRRYAIRGIFNIAGPFFLALIIIAFVTCLGVVWEAIELSFDLFIQPSYADWLAKAQKNSVDTVLDILTNFGFSVVAMAIAAAYQMIHRRRYPDEFNHEEVEEIGARIEHLIRDLRERHHERSVSTRRELRSKIHRLTRHLRKPSS